MDVQFTGLVQVAVGVVFNQQQQILVALRPQNLHQGGLWEFPGGKIKVGETPSQALVRELKEEVGIVAEVFTPLKRVYYEYPDKRVLLDVWCVASFSGEAKGCEGQEIAWVALEQLAQLQFPMANKTIIDLLMREKIC